MAKKSSRKRERRSESSKQESSLAKMDLEALVRSMQAEPEPEPSVATPSKLDAQILAYMLRQQAAERDQTGLMVPGLLDQEMSKPVFSAEGPLMVDTFAEGGEADKEELERQARLDTYRTEQVNEALASLIDSYRMTGRGAEDIARVTGLPVETVSSMFGATDTELPSAELAQESRLGEFRETTPKVMTDEGTRLRPGYELRSVPKDLMAPTNREPLEDYIRRFNIQRSGVNPKVQTFEEGGEVEQMTVGTLPADREPSDSFIGRKLAELGISPADFLLMAGKLPSAVGLALTPTPAGAGEEEELARLRGLAAQETATTEGGAAKALLQAVKSKNPAAAVKAVSEVGSASKDLTDFLKQSVVKQRLYHGTPSSRLPEGKPFNEFETDLIWMSSRPKFSEEFGDFIMPLHAQIKNPYDFDKTGGVYKDARGRVVKGRDGEPVEVGFIGDNPQIVEDMIRRGYDGAVEGAGEFVVAFDPKQVRSAFDFPLKTVGGAKGPEIKKSGRITELEKRLKEEGGVRQAQRLQRAADEIPGLENQYQSNALMRAFLGRKGYPYQGVMTMKPEDFEQFALPLGSPLSQNSKERIEKLREVLAQGGVSSPTRFPSVEGAFDDVPFLMMDRKDNIPFIAGHEGRHRMRALSKEGYPTTLVEVYPRSALEMGGDYERLTATEWLKRFNEALGKDRLVVPEDIDPDLSVIKRKLPETYAEGGEVTNDEFIQQMMTGTRPTDQEADPNVVKDIVRGVQYTPFDVLGAPVDIATMVMRPFGYNVEKPVGGSDWFIEQAAKRGLAQPSTGSGAELLGRIAGGVTTPAVAKGVGKVAEKTEDFISGQLDTAARKVEERSLAKLRAQTGNPNLTAKEVYDAMFAAQAPGVAAVKPTAGAPVVSAPKNQMGFYSAVEDTILNLPQEKGTAQQFLAQISKAPGVKPGELKATGLEEFLKSKGTAPVTREEVRRFLDSNKVQVNEVVLGEGQVLSPEAKRLADEAFDRMGVADNKMAPFFEQMIASNAAVGGQDPFSVFNILRSRLGLMAIKGDQAARDEINALNLPPDVKQAVFDYATAKEAYQTYAKQARRMEKPKFDKYNIPGGENAREIYLTLPFKEPAIPEGYKITPIQYDDGTYRYFAETPTTRSQAFRTKQEAMNELQEQITGLREFREKQKVLFDVPHSHSVSPEADRNRIAHIFLDDRTDAEGKKVLFVQELQSDWAQQGRDKGFADNSVNMIELNKQYDALNAERRAVDRMIAEGDDANPATQAAVDRAVEINNQMNALSDRMSALKYGISPAPFVTNTEDWVNLALKRVINEAVDKGYDKVAFISGKQAADKYRLSTVLDAIEVSPLPTTYISSTKQVSPGSRVVELKRKDGGIIETYVNKEGTIEAVADVPFRQLTGKPLSEVVGKEMAEKVMATELKDKDSTIFTVKDMEVGGEGMKGFYDNVLPKTANKLLAKLGSKIEPVVMEKEVPIWSKHASSFKDWMTVNHPEVSSADAARAWAMGMDNNSFVKEYYEATKPMEQLGFKITPEMVEMVKTKGLPQFAAGGEVTKFIRAHA